eukprot:TRINITY_DN8318_c0_g1_i1.p1 TRINITY_DN8318_c0_g1~~TRINITY_DN8318_c0_g1_i1.p1  ORF type:complete len:104 (+),score=42.32 TRINITY_DN8318_c0_g1_i1:174-485(+)
MCIRDRHRAVLTNNLTVTKWLVNNNANVRTQNNRGETVLHTSVHCGLDDVLNYLLHVTNFEVFNTCLLYTSDAADDLLCVDLGGRRIITKKKKIKSRDRTTDK